MTEKALDNKVVLITGVASGIGKGIAQCFAKEGAFVVGVDINDKNGPIIMAGINGEYVHCDIRQWDKGGYLEETVKAVLRRFGRIDILVNNAGRQTGKGFLELSPEEIEDITRLNYFAPFRLMQLVARSMIGRRIPGSIINITSVHSEIIRGFPEYSGTKAALKMVSREAAYALGPYGIRVNCIAPGATEGEGMGLLLNTNPAVRQMVIGRTPLGRIGHREDIAEAALFLASDASSFITGAEIVADGGISQRNEAVEDKIFPNREIKEE